MPKEQVIVEGVRHFACSVCHKPLVKGYDSPGTPGDVVCGPHYQEQFAVIYQAELAKGTATLPDVPDDFLPGVVEEAPEPPTEGEPTGAISGIRRRFSRQSQP